MNPLRLLLRAAIPLVFVVQADAQHIRTITVRPQHAREKLYTLKANESVYYNEYSLFAVNKGTNYAFVLKRPGGLYLVYNGKEEGPYDDVRDCPGLTGIWVCQGEKRSCVLDITSGKKITGFKSIYPVYQNGETYPVFYCSKDGKDYLYDMKAGKTFGPFENLRCYRYNEKKHFFSTQNEKGEWTVYSNNKHYGPFKKEPQLEYLAGADMGVFHVNEAFEGFPAYYQFEDGSKIGDSRKDVNAYNSFYSIAKNKWVLVSQGQGKYVNNRRLSSTTIRFDDGKTVGPINMIQYSFRAENGHYAYLESDSLGKNTTVCFDGRPVTTSESGLDIISCGPDEVYYCDKTSKALFRNGMNTGLTLSGYTYNAVRTSANKKRTLIAAVGDKPGVYENGRKLVDIPSDALVSYNWGFTDDEKSGYITYSQNATIRIKLFDGRTFGPYTYLDKGEGVLMSGNLRHVGFIAGGYAYIDGQRQEANAFHMTYDNDATAYRWISLDKKTVYLDTFELE